MEEKKHRKTKRKKHIFGRILAFLGVTLLCVIITLAGVVWVSLKGPSPTMAGMVCNSMRETSALRWIPELFLSEEELDSYLLKSTEDLETEQVNTSLIHIAEARQKEDNGKEIPYLEVVDIAYGTCRGKLLIIRDPKSVILGVSGRFGVDPGLQLTDMVAKYNGIAGTNAGGFIDNNGLGNGGTPTGMVIVDGEILFGDQWTNYNVIGLDNDGILHVGRMSGEEALNKGMKYAVSFVTHDGIASDLVINGNVQTKNLGPGVNPRTAIGQREDGALLLLVLDGRSSKTLGATLENVVDIMLSYDAVTVGNLDGGSSSVMVYDGEIINNCASVTGPRGIPTGFIVLREEDVNG
ncbi:MAG: phosphodiester glycosidase family protein [Oscillospiraceae bacterium]|nr:phosphodiester glycosidase family protein [Oscillospiraceae bacterium]